MYLSLESLSVHSASEEYEKLIKILIQNKEQKYIEADKEDTYATTEIKMVFISNYYGIVINFNIFRTLQDTKESCIILYHLETNNSRATTFKVRFPNNFA